MMCVHRQLHCSGHLTELFVKPNRVVMVAGAVAMTGCVGFLAYWKATEDNRRDTYMALTESGELEKRTRYSRWD